MGKSLLADIICFVNTIAGTLRSPTIKYAAAFLMFMWHIIVSVRFSTTDFNESAIEKYGILATICLYLLKIPVFMCVPFLGLCLLGVGLDNPFKNVKSLKSVTNSSRKEFVCFRVVTRGLYPDLVRKVVDRNISTCIENGVKNFIFEVVTDNRIDLKKCHEIRELVVPKNYCTSKGSLFKARALNYCLESDVSIYSDEDWIVHLDEETLVTGEALYGIFEFISKGDLDIGQGCVTYANGTIVNWFTTLADGGRVAFDYGCMRYTLGYLQKPYVYFKGSYIVLKTATEKDVSFDMTPYCSITEDIYFALKASTIGHSFGYIKGAMHEKSPFTLMDYWKQRGRWCRGLYHVIFNSDIPWTRKTVLTITWSSWIIGWCLIINAPLQYAYPVYVPALLQYILAITLATATFSYWLGNYIQMDARYSGEIVRPLFFASLAQGFLFLFGFLESCIFIHLFKRNKIDFHIVDKDIEITPDPLHLR